ncbi:transposable element Tc1 transposase [Trichonephila clavipes]|nr:transposable element Tc1 transposase [Trichonephila clavipes]
MELIGVHLAGVPMSRTTTLVGVSRIITAYTNLCGHPKTQDYAAADNAREEYPPSKFRIHESYSMGAANIQGRVAIPKPLVSARNAMKKWCRDHLNWTQLQWEQVIWSDESLLTLIQTTGRLFVRQTPTEAFHVDCLALAMKLGGGSMMVWGAMFSRGLGSLVLE